MGLFVIAYDIRKRNRWNKVHRLLTGTALPIQYSVFLFTGSKEEFERCMATITSYIDEKEDDLRFYELPKRGLKLRLGSPSLPEGICFSEIPKSF